MTVIMNNALVAKTAGFIKPIYSKLDYLSPVSILALRLWVAWVFFKSGMLKFNSWDSTLYLFEYEYAVPLIPFELAAFPHWLFPRLRLSVVSYALPALIAMGEVKHHHQQFFQQ